MMRTGSRKVQSRQVGNWSSRFCYKMLSDSHGFLYAGCEANATIFKLDSRDFLQVEKYYQDEDALEGAFSLDTFGNFWLMATVQNGTQKFNKLLVKSSAGSLIY
ncbi:Hypothetical predicted protein [Cloeon dipterum]|uniref:Uncharacterized protein n=1 Tax=Cloeon dipterum TaxID=197152 RepID=A0A8S1DMH0_9INSE|nr:Hypothetical predicted protein [Cloeon dipterum]